MSPPNDRRVEWERWKEQTFGTAYDIWHDGLYTGVVTGLTGEARASAVAMLRLGLALGDDHAAEALAAMGEAGDADAMRAELARATGAARVRIALALHEIAPDPKLAAELVGILEGGFSWPDRIDAAIGLRRFRGADDEAALLRALVDDEYLVRYHASESLLSRWGIEPASITSHGAIFSDLCGPTEGTPTEEDRARYGRAREALGSLASTRRA
jgi:hypothetical protein